MPDTTCQLPIIVETTNFNLLKQHYTRVIESPAYTLVLLTWYKDNELQHWQVVCLKHKSLEFDFEIGQFMKQ